MQNAAASFKLERIVFFCVHSQEKNAAKIVIMILLHRLMAFPSKLARVNLTAICRPHQYTYTLMCTRVSQSCGSALSSQFKSCWFKPRCWKFFFRFLSATNTIVQISRSSSCT
uniref:(northern house mosquito) hypothetical protein n=1 Tax=Culex pipiens TaxID=7175 RepID=A0A8D8NZS6_CULPI